MLEELHQAKSPPHARLSPPPPFVFSQNHSGTTKPPRPTAIPAVPDPTTTGPTKHLLSSKPRCVASCPSRRGSPSVRPAAPTSSVRYVVVVPKWRVEGGGWHRGAVRSYHCRHLRRCTAAGVRLHKVRQRWQFASKAVRPSRHGGPAVASVHQVVRRVVVFRPSCSRDAAAPSRRESPTVRVCRVGDPPVHPAVPASSVRRGVVVSQRWAEVVILNVDRCARAPILVCNMASPLGSVSQGFGSSGSLLRRAV